MDRANNKVVEKRREKRWNLKIHLRVFDQDTDALLGHAVDIATKGMQVISEEPIATEKNFRLWLELILTDGNWQKVPLRALSVWCRKRETGLYSTGFHIFSIPAESLTHIRHLLDTPG